MPWLLTDPISAGDLEGPITALKMTLRRQWSDDSDAAVGSFDLRMVYGRMNGVDFIASSVQPQNTSPTMNAYRIEAAEYTEFVSTTMGHDGVPLYSDAKTAFYEHCAGLDPAVIPPGAET